MTVRNNYTPGSEPAGGRLTTRFYPIDLNEVGTDLNAATTKLAGIATGATANTTESIQDVVGAMIVNGTNTTAVYNDGAGTLAINASGGGGGASVGWTNVVSDHSADPTGVADSSSAFAAALATGKAVYVPRGTFKINTPLNELDAISNQVHFFGDGPSHSLILPATGQYFIDTPDAGYNMLFEGLQFNGGKGATRFSFTGATSNGANKAFTDCVFRNYTGAAVVAMSSDSPFWKFTRCHFIGANETSTIGIALAGFVDSLDIFGCEFWTNRVHLKTAPPNNIHVFGGWSGKGGTTSPGNPRVAMWFVPKPDGTNLGTAGGGGLIQGFKFGNDAGLNDTDRHIVVADEGTGTDFGDKFPNLTTASTGFLFGVTVKDCYHMNAGTDVPLVYSMTPYVYGCTIATIVQVGSSSPVMAPLLRFKDATGFVPENSIVGPVVNYVDPYHPPVALTQTETGTLTAQPPMLGQPQNCRNIVRTASAITIRVDSILSVFTGTTATWTLPPLVNTGSFIDNTGAPIEVANDGTGNLTVQRAGTDNIRSAAATVTSVTVASGASAKFRSDGVNWVKL